MEAVWLLVGLVAGAAVGFALIRRESQRLRGELAEARSEAASLAARADAAEIAARTGEAEKLKLEGELGAEIAGLRAQIAAEQRSAEEKVSALVEARDQMIAQVKQGAGEALGERGKELVETLKAELNTKRVEADGDLERRQKAVEEFVAPVKTMLEQMDSSLKTLDKDRRQSHAELTTRIEGLLEAQSALQGEAGTLAKALRQPHTRGRWGEMHLRRLAEMTGMSSHCDFTEQVQVDGDDGPLRPDVVFHLPQVRDVVVDAKAPLAPYYTACEVTDEAAQLAAVKLFARGLRAHVKKLAAKDYASQFETAPDFVVMYLPGDHYLNQALEADPELIEYAMTRKVLIATPATMIAMLKTIAMAWQQELATAEAQQIVGLGQQLYERLGKYLSHVDLVSKRLNSAVAAQNSAVGSLEGRVLPTARRFPGVGAVAIDADLGDVRVVTSRAREVQALELEAGGSEVDEEEGKAAA